MRSFTTDTTIDAPVKAVWPVLADVVRWPQWTPTVTSVQPFGDAPLAIGARYRLVQPKLRPAVWLVVELAPHSHFLWESRSPGVRTRATHAVRTASAGSTHVSLGVEFSGCLSGMAAAIAGRVTREYIRREAAALKLRVESGV